MGAVLIKSILRILAWLYPLIIWFLHDRLDSKPLVFSLLALLTLDWLLTLPRKYLVAAVSGVAILLMVMMSLASDHAVRLYPFLMTGSVLHAFARTRNPEENPMIGPMRRFIKMDDELLQYLHQAKRIWLVGLSLNCVVFFVFLIAFDTKAWALYAGVYSYLFLLLLFLITMVYVGIKRKRIL
jgi:uncharacterized membrane protein